MESAAPRALADPSHPVPVSGAKTRPTVNQSLEQAEDSHLDEFLEDREVGSPARSGHSGVAAPLEQFKHLTNGGHFQTIMLLLQGKPGFLVPLGSPESCMLEGRPYFLLSKHGQYVRPLKFTRKSQRYHWRTCP